MFDIGPDKLIVLVIVGLIVLGPERLPGLARDAARMIRNLRELATGAQQQLREGLGPELADLDLRSLNPRTVIQRALFDDDDQAAQRPAAPPARPVTPDSSAGSRFDPDAT